MILSGIKRVEFRKSWATHKVSLIVLYSSSPVQKIVGMVRVDDVIIDSPCRLWDTCTKRSGGLTKEELDSYFLNKKQGVAVLLGDFLKPKKQIEPSEIINDFFPPQSFRYMEICEYEKLKEKIFIEEEA